MPELFIAKKLAVVDDATMNRSVVAADTPVIESDAAGVELPIPTLPDEVTVKSFALVDAAMVKISLTEPAVPVTANLADGVELPMPTLPSV